VLLSWRKVLRTTTPRERRTPSRPGACCVQRWNASMQQALVLPDPNGPTSTRTKSPDAKNRSNVAPATW
jgi:hypothetical protein